MEIKNTAQVNIKLEELVEIIKSKLDSDILAKDRITITFELPVAEKDKNKPRKTATFVIENARNP